MITKLMDRLFSGVDDEFMNDLDRARDKGILNRVDVKFTRLPDETIQVYDKDNDEMTIIKKSGSEFIAKSGEIEDSLPNSIRHFGPIPEKSGEVKASDYIELFSNKSVDLTKVFGIFGRPIGKPLNPDDSHRINSNLVSQREQLDDLNMAIKKKSNEEIKGTPDKVKHQELVNQRQLLDRDKLIAKITGNEALLSNNPGKLKTATKQLFDEETKRADVDYKIGQIKQKLDKENKQAKDNEAGSGINKSSGVASNRTLTTGRASRRFSSLQYQDSFYSHAGYENEHTLLIGKLSELKLAPNDHSKSKLLGDLSNLIDKINDESINKITKSMLSELKKIKLDDPQYSEILDDLIESLTSDSMTRLFAINRDTYGHHNEEDLKAMRDANLGKTINANKVIGTAAVMGATAGLAASGALNPLGTMLKTVGSNIGKAVQWGNPIAMFKRYLSPNSAEGQRRQAEIAHENSIKDKEGNPVNVQAESELNPIRYNLKALIPLTPQNRDYKHKEYLGNQLASSGGKVAPIVRAPFINRTLAASK